MSKLQSSTLAKNKKAFADFEVIEKYEAGIALTGPEVKSVRAGHSNLKGSYAEITKKKELYAKGIHVSPYKPAVQQQKEYSPVRKRKLLLHKKEIEKLETELNEKGTTLIPLDLHLSKNKIKLTIGVCRGKKKHDRRNELKKRAQNIDINRALKNYK